MNVFFMVKNQISPRHPAANARDLLTLIKDSPGAKLGVPGLATQGNPRMEGLVLLTLPAGRSKAGRTLSPKKPGNNPAIVADRLPGNISAVG